MGGEAVSSLQRGDEDLHYSDHSHRWIAPSDVEQELWEAELATHLERHRAGMGSPLSGEERGKCRNPRIVPARPAPVPARIIPPRRTTVGAARR